MSEPSADGDGTTRPIVNVFDEQLSNEEMNAWQNSTVLSMSFRCDENAGKVGDMATRDNGINLTEQSERTPEIDDDYGSEMEVRDKRKDSSSPTSTVNEASKRGLPNESLANHQIDDGMKFVHGQQAELEETPYDLSFSDSDNTEVGSENMFGSSKSVNDSVQSGEETNSSQLSRGFQWTHLD